MNSTNTNTISYSLHDIENYKHDFGSYTIKDILSMYNKLIIEYLNFITDASKLNATNSIIYNKFIIIRGLKTITHVFNTILYYTRNLDMALYYGQKSFYFYVEFITQISGRQSFLQLTSRDAILFVYKKSIFEINNECRKSINNSILTETTTQLFNTLDIYITNMNHIVTHILERSLTIKENINKLEKIIYQLNNNNICDLVEFVDKLDKDSSSIDSHQYFDQIEQFIGSSK
jgi:hypothetical protein